VVVPIVPDPSSGVFYGDAFRCPSFARQGRC